jgi:hypothetical protein
LLWSQQLHPSLSRVYHSEDIDKILTAVTFGRVEHTRDQPAGEFNDILLGLLLFRRFYLDIHGKLESIPEFQQLEQR